MQDRKPTTQKRLMQEFPQINADVAEESSNYIQAQILQQAAATLLATANQTPSIALNLV